MRRTGHERRPPRPGAVGLTEPLWPQAAEPPDLSAPDPATGRAAPAPGPGLRLIIRTDGAARGNPGPASAGAVIVDASRPDARSPHAKPLATISAYLGIQTNNVAEYTALVHALALAEEFETRQVDLFLDSQLIVEQLHGRYRVRDAKLAPLHAKVRTCLAGFDRWSATHVPRAENQAADALANAAIDRVMAGGPAIVVTKPGG